MRNAKDGVVPIPQRQRPDRMMRNSTTSAAATAVVAAAAAAAADVIKCIDPVGKQEEVKRPPLRDAKRSHEQHREMRRRDGDGDKKREENKVDEKPQQPVREWDRNKFRPSPERERPDNHRKRHSSGQGQEEVEAKKRRRSDENTAPSKPSQKEEPPAKLLDDLFRKTKATPCIYWLPLTEEQIAEKEKHVEKLEEERIQRRAERNKKLDEERDERMRARAVAQREREGDRRRDF